MTTPEELDALQGRLDCDCDEPICTLKDARAAITALRARVAELEAEVVAAWEYNAMAFEVAADRDRIEKTLRQYRMQYTWGEDGLGYPLVDACSPGPTIEEGELEIHLIADAVCAAILDCSPTNTTAALAARDKAVREQVLKEAELAHRGQGVPLTANALADAFEAMWNAAIGVAIERQEGIAVASMLAEGFAAMGRHLRESAALVSPGDGWRDCPVGEDGYPMKFGDIPRDQQFAIFTAWLDGRPLEQWINQIIGWRPSVSWPPFKKNAYRITPPASEGANHG